MQGRFSPRNHWAALLLVTLSAVSGCHKLFGDFEIADPAIETPTTLCEAGSFRCVGPWLYTCGPNLNSWVEQDRCASEEHCDSRAGRCRECIPETHRCNDKQLEVCGSDGSWSLVDACATADECNLNSDSCRPCTVGEFQCNAGIIQQCANTETWTEIQQCDSEETCFVADDRKSASCTPQACAVGGQHRCNGAQLLRCTLARDREVEVASCPDPALCDPVAADAQASQGLLATCLTPCTAGELRCVGAELQTCNAFGNGWDVIATCASDAECSVSAGTCQPCTLGTIECNGALLRRCNETGAWEELQRLRRATVLQRQRADL